VAAYYVVAEALTNTAKHAQASEVNVSADTDGATLRRSPRRKGADLHRPLDQGGSACRWIDGYERSGKNYEPILRIIPRDTPWVTWREFVEAPDAG
jgi:hypothetical protein